MRDREKFNSRVCSEHRRNLLGFLAVLLAFDVIRKLGSLIRTFPNAQPIG